MLNQFHLLLTLNFVLKVFRLNLGLPKVGCMVREDKVGFQSDVSTIGLMLLDVFSENDRSTLLVGYALNFCIPAVKSFVVQDLQVWQNFVAPFVFIIIFFRVILASKVLCM
jgi:hypothetical protein